MKHPSRLKTISLVLASIIAGSSWLTSGCAIVAAGAVGAGAVAYMGGQLRAGIAANPEAVMDATENTIRELKFFVTEQKRDALTAVYEMRNAKDDKITIVVEQETPGLTQVRIRVGLFGNEALSQIILDKIKANL